MAEKLFSTADIAQHFRKSRQSVNDWIKDRAFPNVVRVGRSYAVPASDVTSHIDAEIRKRLDEIEALKEVRERVVEASKAG